MLMPSIFRESPFDNFFEEFSKPAKITRLSNTPAVMKTDIQELENGFKLEVDLPGYKKEDVKAELDEGYLTIRASKESESDTEEKGKYIRRERYFGSTSRSFYVGDQLTKEDIEANFENGTLRLFVPKIEEKAIPEEDKYIAIAG